MEYEGGNDNDIECGVKTPLEGNGDFRNQECIEILKESDIVVTNPPFSLFREYVAQLMEYEKKFVIVGNKNAITYKEIFPLLKDNEVWMGYNSPAKFNSPTGEKNMTGLCRWFTNLDIANRHEKLILWKNYNEEEFPKYDNYDAINVDKVSEIPCDYDGVMGVPITFLDKFNPEQFEILGIANSARWIGYECLTLIDGKKIYNRILIRKRTGQNKLRFIDLINQAKKAQEMEIYFPSLAQGFALIDACARIEYPNDTVSSRYIKWCDKYMVGDFKHLNQTSLPYTSGEVLYQLRCQLLHEGNVNVDFVNKIRDEKNKVNEFELVITHHNPIGSPLGIMESGKMSLNIDGLCNLIFDETKRYYENNVSKFETIPVYLVKNENRDFFEDYEKVKDKIEKEKKRCK